MLTALPTLFVTTLKAFIAIGGFGYFVEICRRVLLWFRRNYLSIEEKNILKEMMINNHRVLFEAERSDFPLHIKMQWGVKPYPSDDKREIVKYYEKFQELLEKKFVCHAIGEIYILTSKGIQAAHKILRTGDKEVDTALQSVLSSN